MRFPLPLLVLCVLGCLVPGLSRASDLDDDLGRNEVRVYSGRFSIESGRTITQLDLPRRLERLGYERRQGEQPKKPGEYFFGFEKFWFYRRPMRIGKKQHPARMIGLRLRREDGMILGGIDGNEAPLRSKHLWLEPELLAESFDTNRGRRSRVRFEQLPEHVWQPVLAAEDGRFFEHSGVDAQALARATLRNVKAGKVVQGGSTITQQLVKLRDLSPKRSMGRKASEAVRALALEAEYDKTEILEAYLNAVYFGHLDGVQIFGLGSAARAYFSKSVDQLDVAESALLAAMIQGPNRLSPVRNPEAVLERYRWVLTRLVALDWLTPTQMHDAHRRGLPSLRPSAPALPDAPYFLDWLEDEVESNAPRRAEDGRGAVVFSTLDPLLQEAAEEAVLDGLRRLRSGHSRLRAQPLSAALVALDTHTGDVLAYVGGDPRLRSDSFDRARRAERQPGSAVKPLVLLEPLQDCGGRDPLFPARRVSDQSLTLDLPSGPWSPENPDHEFRPSVSVRQATVQSLNVPFVRIGRWCGFRNTAERLRRSGMELPKNLPPAFVLGAVETTPLTLARAYTVFGSLGRAFLPRPYDKIFLPGGRLLVQHQTTSVKVVEPATAYLIRDLLEDSVRQGTSAAAALENHKAFGKTGTSSRARDAWFAGGAGSVVAVVWVGLDDNDPLRLSGAAAAAPIWKAFMERAVPLRPAGDPGRPAKIVEHWFETETGLLVPRQRSGAELDLFRKGATPPKRRLLKKDEPVPEIE
jgi:penicillin-binding protein 1B